jgi:hypothetical protein
MKKSGREIELNKTRTEYSRANSLFPRIPSMSLVHCFAKFFIQINSTVLRSSQKSFVG